MIYFIIPKNTTRMRERERERERERDRQEKTEICGLVYF